MEKIQRILKENTWIVVTPEASRINTDNKEIQELLNQHCLNKVGAFQGTRKLCLDYLLVSNDLWRLSKCKQTYLSYSRIKISHKTAIL